MAIGFFMIKLVMKLAELHTKMERKNKKIVTSLAIKKYIY